MVKFSNDDSLQLFLSACIKGSNVTLDELNRRTGIHRSKLGRIRLAQGVSSAAEALCILHALGRPAKADMLLLLLGGHDPRFLESVVFLDEFLTHVPTLIERLSALGSWLNPRWARGTALIVAEAIERQVERIREADASLS